MLLTLSFSLLSRKDFGRQNANENLKKKNKYHSSGFFIVWYSTHLLQCWRYWHADPWVIMFNFDYLHHIQLFYGCLKIVRPFSHWVIHVFLKYFSCLPHQHINGKKSKEKMFSLFTFCYCSYKVLKMIIWSQTFFKSTNFKKGYGILSFRLEIS